MFLQQELIKIWQSFSDDPQRHCADLWANHGFPITLALVLVVVPAIMQKCFSMLLERGRRATEIRVERVRSPDYSECKSHTHIPEGKHAHFLDISQEYIERAANKVKHDPDTTQVTVMSLSQYLHSIRVTPSGTMAELAVRASLRLLVELIGPSVSQYLLPFLPRIGKDVVSPQVERLPEPPTLGKILGDFPSLLVGAAAVDVMSRKDLIEGSGIVGACDRMATGEEPGVKPALPDLPSRLVLTGPETLDNLVNQMDLGDNPDVKHYATPRPFAPELLPDLCVGWGGLTPPLTPREHARHRLVACILNKLAANVLSLAGFRWEAKQRQTEHSKETDPTSLDDIEVEEEIGDVGDEIDPFVLTIQNGPNGKPIDVLTPWDLVDLLVEDDSFKCWFQTNHTSFGVSLCVLHPERGEPSTKELLSTNPDDRKLYSQIPLSPCARSDLLNVETGEPLKQLGIHSSLVFKADNHPLLGSFQVLFYTGMEGFSGFHRDYRYEIPCKDATTKRNTNARTEMMNDATGTNPIVHRQNNRDMSKSDMVDVTKYATLSAVVNNACAKRLKLPNGGFGSVGVCNDSIAVLQMALWGKCTIFPLLGRSPAKSTALHFAKNELLAKLLTPTSGFVSRLASLTSTPLGAEDREKNLRAVARDALEKVIQSMVLLPQDLQIEPRVVPDALRRLQDCTHEESPFVAVKQLAKQLPTVVRQWDKLLGDDGVSYFG